MRRNLVLPRRAPSPAFEHAVEVTAESLYEAVALSLGILRGDMWVEEIGEGFDGVEGARQAAGRRAQGEDEGFQAVAGVAGEDAGSVRAEKGSCRR